MFGLLSWLFQVFGLIPAKVIQVTVTLQCSHELLVYYICTYFIFVPSSPYHRHVLTTEKWSLKTPAILETFLHTCFWYIMYFSCANICPLLTTHLKHRPKHHTLNQNLKFCHGSKFHFVQPFTITGVARLSVKYFCSQLLSSLAWVPSWAQIPQHQSTTYVN
jgi:hypothetical protein